MIKDYFAFVESQAQLLLREKFPILPVHHVWANINFPCLQKKPLSPILTPSKNGSRFPVDFMSLFYGKFS